MVADERSVVKRSRAALHVRRGTRACAAGWDARVGPRFTAVVYTARLDTTNATLSGVDPSIVRLAAPPYNAPGNRSVRVVAVRGSRDMGWGKGKRTIVKFAEIVASLDGDLARVEQRVRGAADVEYPVLGDILRAIVDAGGKRLRPVLMLLVAKPFDYNIAKLAPAAAGVEMLHTASLVHDDTIDKSQLRRGQPTLNSMFDSSTVILIGDYLFAQSAIMTAETMDARAMSVFATILANVCDGQLREIFQSHRIDQTRAEYERRIFGKTASLFAGAAEMGAILSGADEPSIAELRAFGSDFGMAFQIVDDVLDLRATSEQIGKPANLDLRQGTVTLPTMLYLAQANGNASVSQVRRAVDGELASDEEYSAVATLIEESGAIDESLEAAGEYIQRALDRLDIVRDGAARDHLAAYATLALSRTS
jgi:geranylgeranyl pyrophosphate synthase